MFSSVLSVASEGLYLSRIAEWVRDLIQSILGKGYDGVLIPLLDFVFWIFALLILDFILQKLGSLFFGFWANRTRFDWVKKFKKHGVFKTFINFITLYILYTLKPVVFEYYDEFVGPAQKLIDLLIIFVIVRLVFSIVDAITDVYDENETHASVAIHAFGQLIKVFAASFGLLTFLAILINTPLSSILTVLGALMAVVLLIFRDAILGFVSGLQIASSKSIKIGDWISVSKYNLEGIVLEINLVLTKIRKFDKTVATIPTYDLVSSEVTNVSRMSVTRTRRIKRSIVFSAHSIRFCDDEMLAGLQEIDLISDYIKDKKKELKEANKNVVHKNRVINGRQLTNIGVFRQYTENYLKNRPDISLKDSFYIRQQELTATGLPLEIYCFTKASDTLEYSRIQSDVFDHLISAAKDFDLVVSQPMIMPNP